MFFSRLTSEAGPLLLLFFPVKKRHHHRHETFRICMWLNLTFPLLQQTARNISPLKVSYKRDAVVIMHLETGAAFRRVVERTRMLQPGPVIQILFGHLNRELEGKMSCACVTGKECNATVATDKP